MIKIILPGEPVAKMRARVCKNFSYDPQEKIKIAHKYQIISYLQSINFYNPYPSNIPIEIEFTFYMTPKKGEEMLPEWGIRENISKKDIDNLAKFYLDVMNKIVYEDDKQINCLISNKYYDSEPRTIIHIMPKKPKVSEKVKEILSMISPEEFYAFSHDLSTFSDLYDDLGTVNPCKAALLICQFAEKHTEVLTKIKKKFPGFAKVIKEELSKK